MSRIDYTITDRESEMISQLVALYETDMDIFGALLKSLVNVVELPAFRQLYHSARWRVKHPDHLRDKLEGKLLIAKKSNHEFDITGSNLFERINDLAGLRLLHLHTSEFDRINKALLPLLDEHGWSLIEGPIARVWDQEYTDYFHSIGVETKESARMYTSVHYVVLSSHRTKRTAEIQVRTLAEELWGEVDHSINYPTPSPTLACREQIKVLARLTSSCTRLVDSIFASHEEVPSESGHNRR